MAGLPRYAGTAPVRIAQRAAALHAARLRQGQGVQQLPEAPYLHLFVTRGAVTLEDMGALTAGDAVRLTASGGQRVVAASSSELLVWEMGASL